MNNARVSWFLSVIMVTVFFFGCATTRKETDRSELLKDSAEKYWKLRFEDKYKDAYEMEDKNGLPEFEGYRQQASRIKKFRLESYSIANVEVEGDKGRVKVGIIFYLLDVPTSFRETISEEWIFRDGKWLHRFPVE